MELTICGKKSASGATRTSYALVEASSGSLAIRSAKQGLSFAVFSALSSSFASPNARAAFAA